MVNCEIELDFSWSVICVISEISRTTEVATNPPNLATDETKTDSGTFQINSAKLYVPVVTLSIYDNIRFLENIKQGLKRTVSWDKYRSELTMQPKNDNLDHMIYSTFWDINRLFILFKNGNSQTRSVWKNCRNVEKWWLYDRKLIRLFALSKILYTHCYKFIKTI